MFPVVELAAAANRWLSRGGDLVFETMEAEESPFLWVRDEAGGCTVGAAWQVFEERRRSLASRSATRGRGLSTTLWRKCGCGLASTLDLYCRVVVRARSEPAHGRRSLT